MAILKRVYAIIYSLVFGKTQGKRSIFTQYNSWTKKLFNPFLIPRHLKHTQKK